MYEYNDLMIDLQYAQEEDLMLRKGAVQEELERRKQTALAKITAYAAPFTNNNEVISRLICIALKGDSTSDIFHEMCDLTQEDLLALQDNEFGIKQYLYANFRDRLEEYHDDYRYIG